MTDLVLDRLGLIYTVQLLMLSAVLLPVNVPVGSILPVTALFLPVLAPALPVSALILK